jgi:hypothetical protein
MRRFVMPLAALALAGLLLPANVRPAHACSCAAPASEEQVREVVDYYDAVVLGAIADVSPDRSTVSLDVEASYKGPAAERLTLEQPAVAPGPDSGELAYLGADCSFALLGERGERYVLFLSDAGSGVYEAGGCSSFPLAWTAAAEEYGFVYETLEGLAGPGTLPPTGGSPSESDSSPWRPFALGAAVAGAGLALSAAWLVRQRARL